MKRFLRALTAITMIFVVTLSPGIPCSAAVIKPEYTRISKISSNTSDSVSLRWYKSDDATNYRIYYRAYSGKKWKRIATVSSSVRSYTHSSTEKYPLVSGRKYYYTVRAYNSHYKTLGNYSRVGRMITISVIKNECSDDSDEENDIEDNLPSQSVDNTIDSDNMVVINGVSINLSDFPKTKTIKYGLSGLSITWTSINDFK